MPEFKVIFLLGMLLVCAGFSAYSFDLLTESDLKSGDLLFQDLDGNPLYDAIESIKGINSARLTHVGLVSKEGKNIFVFEALGTVSKTPLKKFLSRSHDELKRPKVLVGRVKSKYNLIAKKAVKKAESKLGKPFDMVFDINNDAYYCAELIYYAFKEANNNKDFFKLSKMTFKNPETGKFLPVWEKYFKRIGYEVPEGKPGINPASVSLSSKIRIIGGFGKPQNYSK